MLLNYLIMFTHLDSKKLADILVKQEKNLNKKLKYFIQVNIENEIQKSGISISELEPFFNYCKYEVKLDVVGSMIIPP